MLDFIDGLSREPVLPDTLHVLRSELLQPHDHHVVIHVSKFSPVVVRDCCRLRKLLRLLDDRLLGVKRAHGEERLLRLH